MKKLMVILILPFLVKTSLKEQYKVLRITYNMFTLKYQYLEDHFLIRSVVVYFKINHQLGPSNSERDNRGSLLKVEIKRPKRTLIRLCVQSI